MWVAKIYRPDSHSPCESLTRETIHSSTCTIAIATQVIQLLHSQQIVEVWLVTDENALASRGVRHERNLVHRRQKSKLKSRNPEIQAEIQKSTVKSRNPL